MRWDLQLSKQLTDCRQFTDASQGGESAEVSVEIPARTA